MGWCTILFVYLPIGFVILRIYTKFRNTWCTSQRCLVGKTVIITGANTGIGYETALDLAKRGGKIILACRNEEKAKAACEKIKAETDNPNVSYKLLDLSSLKSVRDFANEINKTEDRLDILINNAGLGGGGYKLTDDGLQFAMQVNYFAHFLLTNLLMDLLKKSAPSRIINMSSVMAKFSLSLDLDKIGTKFIGDTTLYCQSKLCNILFTKELASRLKETGVTAYSVHPGAVNTALFKEMPDSLKFFWDFFILVYFKNVVEGAQVPIYLAVEKNIEHLSGGHFELCKPETTTYITVEENLDITKELWERTAELVKF